MSFEAFVWAWKQPVSNATDLHVLLALANIAPIRETYASATYIGQMTRRSERQVRRSLQNLEADGIVTITERPGRTDLIRLNIPSDFVVSMPPEGDLEAGKRGRPRARKTPDTFADNPPRLGEKPPPVVSGEPVEEPEDEPRASDEALAPKIVAASPERQAFDLWNATATEHGWKLAAIFNDVRKRHIAARLRECDGLPGWRDALNRCVLSPFLSGRTSGKFEIKLDFLLQPSSFTKLLEGYYDHRRPDPPSHDPGGRAASHDRRTDAMLAGAVAAFGARGDNP